MSNSRGDVSCSGKKKAFDGMTTLSFDSFQLPATCLVTIEGGRGVFQVYGSGSVKCNKTGSAVDCSPPAVQ